MNVTPAKIVKFDILEMKRISDLTLPANENRDETRVSAMVTIDKHTIIHASFTDPCVFTKIDTDSMQIVGTLKCEDNLWEKPNDSYIRSMVYDGKFVYAATYNESAKLIKFNPENMEKVSEYYFTPEEASSIHSITMVGDYIVGVSDKDNDNEARIFRIKKDDFSEVESIYVKGVTNYHSSCTDGKYFYATADTNPIKVVKIDVLSEHMSFVSMFTGSENFDVGNFSMGYDGRDVVVGTWNLFNYNGDKLIKLNTDNMEKIKEMKLSVSFPSRITFINGFIYTTCDKPVGVVIRVKF